MTKEAGCRVSFGQVVGVRFFSLAGAYLKKMFAIVTIALVRCGLSSIPHCTGDVVGNQPRSVQNMACIVSLSQGLQHPLAGDLVKCRFSPNSLPKIPYQSHVLLH